MNEGLSVRLICARFAAAVLAVGWNRINPKSKMLIPILLLILTKPEDFTARPTFDLHGVVVRLSDHRVILLRRIRFNESQLIYRDG